MGKVIGIAAQEKESLPITVYASAKISFENGVADDYRGAQQITVITQESWDEVCKELNTKLHWTSSNAQLLIEGIDLVDSGGDILRIGNFYLEIIEANIPDANLENVYVGLKKALEPNWRAGVVAKVYSEGIVNEGDLVTLMEKG